MSLPEIVSREQWRAGRAELLVKEKAATRARDALRAGTSSSSTTSCSRPSGTPAAAAAPGSWTK